MAKPKKKSGELVLIVDDEPAVRRTLRNVLESAGHVCAESENGAAALAWLEENSADLVIADYKMPILNGLQFLKKINKKEERPVILLSGHLETLDKQKALKLGAYAVVDKPCNYRELVMTVDEALEKKEL